MDAGAHAAGQDAACPAERLVEPPTGSRQPAVDRGPRLPAGPGSPVRKRAACPSLDEVTALPGAHKSRDTEAPLDSAARPSASLSTPRPHGHRPAPARHRPPDIPPCPERRRPSSEVSPPGSSDLTRTSRSAPLGSGWGGSGRVPGGTDHSARALDRVPFRRSPVTEEEVRCRSRSAAAGSSSTEPARPLPPTGIRRGGRPAGATLGQGARRIAGGRHCLSGRFSVRGSGPIVGLSGGSDRTVAAHAPGDQHGSQGGRAIEHGKAPTEPGDEEGQPCEDEDQEWAPDDVAAYDRQSA